MPRSSWRTKKRCGSEVGALESLGLLGFCWWTPIPNGIRIASYDFQIHWQNRRGQTWKKRFSGCWFGFRDPERKAGLQFTWENIWQDDDNPLGLVVHHFQTKPCLWDFKAFLPTFLSLQVDSTLWREWVALFEENLPVGVANWIPTTPQTGDRTNKCDEVYQQKWRDQLQTWCILDLLGKSMRT